jgi:tetratricopeptide (TPR) repeat protein
MGTTHQDWHLLIYRNRRRIWAAALLVIGAVLLYVSLLAWRLVAPDSLNWILASLRIGSLDSWLTVQALPLAVVGALLATVVVMAERSCAAWYSERFRAAALRLSVSAGRLYRWCATGWRIAVLLFLLVAVAAEWWHSRVRDHVPSGQQTPNLLNRALDLDTLVKPERLAEVLLGMALVVIVAWAYRSRKRIAILAFANYTGDDSLKAVIDGAAPALRADLMRIVELYVKIDEATPTSRGEAIQPIVGVQDVGETLKGAVSSDAKLSLGPYLQIPVGWIMATLGRLLQGPELTGSIHKEGDNLIVRAQLSGGGMTGNWRVTLLDLDPARRGAGLPQALSLMIEQLACRMFTDLVHVGSVHWRAVRYFSDGLRVYRDARSSQERRSRLFDAEQAFMRALSEDVRFGQCHYNLGVVYRELNLQNSAEAAFRLALRDDPENYEAWYALALNYFHDGRHEDALWLCDQGISLRPGDARAWDLKGLVLRHAVQARLGVETLRAGEYTAEWASIAPTRAIATAMAWRSLCRSALRGRIDPKLRDVARLCSWNLAVAHAMSDAYDAGARIMRQAIALMPSDSDMHFELGKILVAVGRWEEAAKALDRAYEDSLDARHRPMFWVLLAATHANLSARGNDASKHDAVKQEALLHLRDAVAVLDSGTADAISRNIADASSDFDKADDMSSRKEVEAVLAFRQWLDAATEKAMEDALANGELPLDDEWARAQVMIELARRYVAGGREHATARQHLTEAIGLLETRHKAQIRIQGLYGRLALAYVRGVPGEPNQAQHYAHLAAEINPERACERGVLFEVYDALRDFARAESHWSLREVLGVPERSLLESVAVMYWKWGLGMRDREARRATFQRVMEHIRKMLQLVADDPRATVSPAHLAEVQGWGHYWLGQFHWELLQHDRATYHMCIAKEMGYKPLESSLALAATHLEVGAYVNAEEMYREALKQFRDLRKQARQTGQGAPDLGVPLGKPGEDQPLGDLLVEAVTGLASLFAERGVRMATARRLIGCAHAAVLPLGEKRKRNLALVHKCAGLVALRGGHWAEAKSELEMALTHWPDEESYFSLAGAYWHAAQTSATNRQTWLSKCRDACKHARNADLRGRFTKQLEELDAKLDKAEAVTAATSVASP